MKIDWKRLLIALGIPLAVGGLAALLSGGMTNYGAMNKPPLSPPGWVFPVVWTILYLLMGYASYRVLELGVGKERHKALLLYGAQLAANFIWPLLFFGGMWDHWNVPTCRYDETGEYDNVINFVVDFYNDLKSVFYEVENERSKSNLP